MLHREGGRSIHSTGRCVRGASQVAGTCREASPGMPKLLIRYNSASPAGDDKAYYLGVKLSGDDRMDIIAGDVADNSDGNTSNNRYWGRAIRLVMDAD